MKPQNKPDTTLEQEIQNYWQTHAIYQYAKDDHKPFMP